MYVVHDRLFATGPETPPVDPLRELGQKPLWVQKFESSGNLSDEWTLDQIVVDSVQEGSSEVLLRSTGKDPKVWADVDLDSASVSTIVLEGKGLLDGAVLFWSESGAPFVAERGMTAEVVEAERKVVFRVGAHPQWQGKIGRLRIDPTTASQVQFRLDSVMAYSSEVEADAFAAMTEEAIPLEIDNSVRPAQLLYPDRPIPWNVEVRPGDVLQLGVGALGGFVSEFDLRIRGEKDPETELFATTITSDDAGSWRDVQIPVKVASQSLVIEVTSSRTWAPRQGFAALADPVVLRKAHSRSPNLLMISIDTLRADHLSACGYDRATTPRLARRFGGHGVVFDTVVASAPWTLPSHTTMLSGLEALRHGANYDDIPQPEDVDLLAEILRQHGYRSVAWTGGGFMSALYGLTAGFDSYTSWPKAHSPDELESNVAGIEQWIKEHRDSQFFAFLHTYEVHGPFRDRQPYFSQFHGDAPWPGGTVYTESLAPNPERQWYGDKRFRHMDPSGKKTGIELDAQTFVDLYDAGVAYTDDILGEFLDRLEAEGVLENTVVLVTSDHGEALGEHDLHGHSYLYDDNLLVPVLVTGPGVKGRPDRVSEQVRLTDVVPTILDLLHISDSPETDGVSLVPFLRGGSADVPQRAISYSGKTNRGLSFRDSSGLKFIYNDTAFDPVFGTTEMYDLTSDAGELDDVSTESSQLLNELTREVRQMLRSSKHGLDFEVRNTTGQDFSLVIGFEHADKLMVYKVKGDEIGSSKVQLGPGKVFRVLTRPSEGVKLLLLDIESADFDLQGGGDSRPERALNEQVSLLDFGAATTLSFVDDAWTQGAEEKPGAKIVIRFQWRTQPSGVGDADISDEHRRQLEALGYVE